MKLRRGVAAALVAVALPLSLAAKCDAPAPSKPTPSAHCEEDQPCWDCRTMGNRKCAPGEQAL